MNPTLQAQAAQSAQQGQQLLSDFRAKSANAEGQYNTFNQQATQTNQQLKDQAAYMQGEGSGENVYQRNLKTLQDQSGYNPQQLSDANKTLFALSGSLNSANNQFSTPGGVGAYGMSAPALASYEGSILNPLQTGVANANTQVGALNSELGTFETGASQATTSQVQSEQNVVTALTQAVQNYQSQASASLQNMQFYSDLASKQGGLNAQEQQSFAQAQQAYAAATQAIAQSKLFLAQTTGQNLQNQAMQNQLNTPAAKPAAPTPNAAPKAPAQPSQADKEAAIAKTNGVSDLNAVKALPSNPSILQQLFGTGGVNMIHKIGSWF